MGELKPCPFCGGEAKYFIRTVNFGKSWGSSVVLVGVGCSNHECFIKPYVSAIDKNREKTRELWNRRSNA